MALTMMTSALPVTAMAEDVFQTETTTGTAKAAQSSMKISVDEIVKVEEDDTVTLQDVELTAVGTDFEVGETLTLALSSGFGFNEEGEEDSGWADIRIVGDKLELTFVKETDTCNISNMEIDALTARVGDAASLTITGSNRTTATTDVAVVVEKEKTVLFEIGSNEVEVNGKAVTIEHPNPAIWEDKDGTVMIAWNVASRILGGLDGNTTSGWDCITDVVTFSAGNKTVELTVGSEIAVVNGKSKTMDTECIIRNYADGDYVCFPMADFFRLFGAKDWAVLKGEGGFNLQIVAKNPYMTLDIPELEILAGGTVSYDTFGVDTVGRDFELNEIVTLTISEGFEFVESPIHDHDGTILQNVVWSADGKKVEVPVYKAYDTGFDMEAMTIKATTAKIGDEALLTVSAANYPDVSRVIATVADPNALNCSISVDEIVKVEKGDSVTLEDVEIDAEGIDFTISETLRLTLSEGFVFVTNAKTDTDQADIVSFTKDELVLQPKKTTDEIVIEDMEIKATTAEVGDTARLAIVGDKRVSTGVKVAKVVDVAGDTYMDVYVYGRKIVSLPKGGEAALRDVVISMYDDVFDYKEEITLELNEGFEFVNLENISADYNNNGTLEEASSNELVIEAEKGVGKLVIEGVCIKATTAEAGDMAVLTAKHGQFVASTEAAEVVCSEIVLDVKAKTVKNGGKASFDVFGIDKTQGDVFAEGDEVTLTLSEGFVFVEGPVYDHDGTEILVKEWSENKVVVYAPENPGHGFDMEGMTIHATSAKSGEVAKVTAHVDGYEDVTEDVLTVIGSSSSGSSRKPSAPAPAPVSVPVSTEQTTTANGETTTADTTADTVQPVSQTEKAAYQKHLTEEMPDAESVGEGAYTFAIGAGTASAPAGTKDPVKVSFDLSGQKVADPAHLTLVKYVTQADGTVEVVKLGGAYDSAGNIFSAYADGEGVYDLVQDPDVTKITFAIGQTEVSVNDAAQTNDVAPVLHEGKTMVPLRAIAEALGAEVVWDESVQTVHIVQGDKVLSLKVDGADGTAMIMNDRTMVQLRYIGENFGAGVRWIPSTQSIEIVK